MTKIFSYVAHLHFVALNNNIKINYNFLILAWVASATHVRVCIKHCHTLPRVIDYSANGDKNSDVNGFQDTLPSVPFHFPGNDDQDTCA